MVLFKINGERNSGTNFLCEILNKNGFPTYHSNIIGNVIYYWKHGVPCSEQKKLDEKVVDLFIFRELNSWLISMFENPYELENKWNNDFKLFLKTKHSSNNFWKDPNNETLNKDDNDKTIFEIREYKFNKIHEYKKNNKDVIFINLSFIQNEQNMSYLLDYLSSKYMPLLSREYIPNVKNNYILSTCHTKSKSDVKNRKYDINIDDYKYIINSSKNEKLEDFINNLSFI